MRRWMTVLLCALLMLPLGPAAAQAGALTQGAQDVLRLLEGGDYAAIEAKFDEAMRAVVDAAALESAWQNVTALLGAVTGVSAAQEDEASRTAALLEMTDEQAQRTTVFGVSAVYQRHLARMDQAQIAGESGKPYLFLWGEADFQVDRAAFEAWHERLGDDARYTYKSYPGLSHLFTPAGEEDSILNAQAAYQSAKLVDARVAEDIAAWIFAQQHMGGF